MQFRFRNLIPSLPNRRWQDRSGHGQVHQNVNHGTGNPRFFRSHPTEQCILDADIPPKICAIVPVYHDKRQSSLPPGAELRLRPNQSFPCPARLRT